MSLIPTGGRSAAALLKGPIYALYRLAPSIILPCLIGLPSAAVGDGRHVADQSVLRTAATMSKSGAPHVKIVSFLVCCAPGPKKKSTGVVVAERRRVAGKLQNA